MSRVRSVLAWFVFIAGAFALPAASVGVHHGRPFRCQHSCVTPELSKWPSRQIKKDGLTPRSAVAERANIKSRALAVIDTELRRRLNRQMPLTKEGSDEKPPTLTQRHGS